MRGIRGVSLSNDRTYASATIRGLGEPNDYGNRMLVLNDGAVLNDNLLNSSYIGTDQRADLGDVDRIEVVRGPGSLLYGAGAMSGVINIVPRAKDEPSSVYGGMGTYDNSIFHGRAGFHYNFSPKVGAWASISGTRSDGTSLEVEPRDTTLGSKVIADQVDFQRGWGTQGRFWAGPLTVQWYYNQRRNHVPIGPYGTIFNDARTFLSDERFLGEVRFEPQLTSSLQLMLRAHVNHYNYDAEYIYAPPPDAPYVDSFNGTWLGGEARLVWTPVRDLRLTAGGEVQGHLDASIYGSYLDEPYVNEDRPYSIISPYVVGEWGAASWLRLSAGARLNVYPSPNPGDPFQGDEPPVFRAAVIVKPTKTTIIKLMGGNSFRAPSIYEQYFNDGGASYFIATDPTRNFGLKAEEIFTGELEVSQRFSEDWVALGSGWVSQISNIVNSITVDPVTGEAVGADSDSITQRYVNSTDPVLVAGVDVELRREWRQGWMFSAYYGYQRAQYQPGDTADEALKLNPRLVNAPEHLASIRGVVPVVPELASIGARVSLEAPRRIELGNDGVTRPAVIADLTLSGNVRKFGLGYVLGVYNLIDQRYDYPITQSYFGRLSRQNGRTVLFNLNIQYP
ncbi:MAG: TonB-dependent receptor plug domain-containing protein [Polyangiaceae bacterium]|nr:TonB-dependent receptor plug domain-containing protein [Polyangiaceae bacterium]